MAEAKAAGGESRIAAAVFLGGFFEDQDLGALFGRGQRSTQRGIASADEAELLFRLNEACPSQHPAWADFFVETLTDYVVDQSEPEGYLTTDDAKRLVDREFNLSHSASKPQHNEIIAGSWTNEEAGAVSVSSAAAAIRKRKRRIERSFQ